MNKLNVLFYLIYFYLLLFDASLKYIFIGLYNIYIRFIIIVIIHY